jgi:hypothetical protein
MNQTKISNLILIFGLLLAASLVANSAEIKAVNGQQTKRYRSREFAFNYPAGFQVSVEDRGATIRIVPPSRSAYWEDSITIRKLKKNEECDIPQDNSPDTRDNRNIAGHRAYAYSGEDAAMNRCTKEKGYLIEDYGFCWNFELIRRGRPYHKLDLPEKEMKRRDNQADQDFKTVNAAFNSVLNSFVFLLPKK